MADPYVRFNFGRDAEGYYLTINLGGDLMRFRVTDGNFAVGRVQMNNLGSPDTRNNAPAKVVYLADSEPEERPGHHDR